MRDPLNWKTGLIEELRGEATSPSTLCDVELALTLVEQICPDEPPDIVPALLSGNVIPGLTPATLSKAQQGMLARARVLLRVQGHTRWDEMLRTYRSEPELVRMFIMDTGGATRRRAPSVCPGRYSDYIDALSSPPPFASTPKRPAGAGTYFYQVRQDGGRGQQEWHSVKFTEDDIQAIPRTQPASIETVTRERHPLTVQWNDLRSTAAWMDQQSSGGDWLRRMDNMSLDHGRCSQELELDGLYHLVGMVGSGKSTLMDILAVWAARSGRRIMLVVGDNVDVTTRVERFNALGLKSVPLMGVGPESRKRRREQIERVADESGEGWRDSRLKWVSPICPIIGFGSSEPHGIQPGSEPCESLYDARDPDSSQLTCPLMPVCPVHLPRNTMMDAAIWVGTPQSLVLTRAPEQAISENVRLLEVVYRVCDILILDEADRVQTQLDGMFAPSVTLVGTQGNGWIERLDRSAAAPTGRSLSRTVEPLDVAEWSTTQSMSKDAVVYILHLCANDEGLRRWVTRRGYFTAYTLAGQLHSDLTSGSDTNESIPPNLADFLADPDADSPLRSLALDVLYSFNAQLRHRRGQEAIQWLREVYSDAVIDREADEELTLKLQVIALTAFLDNRLKHVFDHWDVGDSAYRLGNRAGLPFHRPPRDFEGLLPTSPTGNLFGFRYRWDQEGEPQIDMFRCTGVGRWLLTHLHDMFEDLDGMLGPHVLLLSGSSWAPGSSGYHVPAPVDGVLAPRAADVQAISQSKAFFDYALDPVGNDPVLISGTRGSLREKNLSKLVAFLTDRSNGKSHIERELELLEQSGDSGNCILMVTGSYDETEQVYNFLKARVSCDVLYLVPDTAEADDTVSWTSLRRGMVHQFGGGEDRILVAPLMAIERGHNIVESDGSARIGSVYFLVRPMPVPNDFSLAVRDMNHWAINRWAQTARDRGMESLLSGWNEYRRDAYRAWYSILRDPGRYRHASIERRSNIAWTQLVALWQTAGRGVRGGSSVRVHFCDAAFAPESAKSGADTEQTSLLVAMRKELDQHLTGALTPDDLDVRDREVCRSLYEPWAAMLANVTDVVEE